MTTKNKMHLDHNTSQMRYREALMQYGSNKNFTNDKETLRLKNSSGWTIAHWQASKNWTTEDEEILLLSDQNGTTVAHVQAERGWTTTKEEILSKRNKYGITVLDNQTYYGRINHQKGETRNMCSDLEILKLQEQTDKKTIVYICHPYSAKTLGEIQNNIYLAEDFGKQALIDGYVPIIPHKISGLWEIDDRFIGYKHEDWINNLCLPLLRVSDIIWMCGDWINHSGCLIEYAEAVKLRKNIAIKTHPRKDVLSGAYCKQEMLCNL